MEKCTNKISVNDRYHDFDVFSLDHAKKLWKKKTKRSGEIFWHFNIAKKMTSAVSSLFSFIPTNGASKRTVSSCNYSDIQYQYAIVK